MNIANSFLETKVPIRSNMLKGRAAVGCTEKAKERMIDLGFWTFSAN